MFLPLTDNNTLSMELGSRHRAGIGVTERSDALSLIVSEETGSISIAQNGQISRYLDIETLKKVLTDLYTSDIENSKVFNFIKGNESKVEEDER